MPLASVSAVAVRTSASLCRRLQRPVAAFGREIHDGDELLRVESGVERLLSGIHIECLVMTGCGRSVLSPGCQLSLHSGLRTVSQ